MNNFKIVGRLTQKPELEYFGERQVARISVAVRRRYKNKDGQYDADFFNLQLWGQRAEKFVEWYDKGHLMAFDIRIENNNYEKNGMKHYGFNFIVETFESYTSRSDKTTDEHSVFESEPAMIDDDVLPF